MTKLDETSIIRIFQNNLKNKKFVSEDVEVFQIGKKKLVSKVDTLVESTDIPSGTKYGYYARKSLVSCLSDFAAKGVKPLFGIISLTIPKRLSKKKVEEIARYFGKASREFDFTILGGDTNEGKELVISVCAFGLAEKIVRRKGASKDDLIFVTGPFGYTAAGLKILQKKQKSNTQFVRLARDSFLKPSPRIKFGGLCRNYFSSSMDSSDGLSLTLNEMSRQSKKKFVIKKIPAKKDLFDFSKKNNLNWKKLVFEGGEEFEIVFTAPKENKTKILSMAKKTKTPLIEIGYVSSGNGVVLMHDSKLSILKDVGWRHF